MDCQLLAHLPKYFLHSSWCEDWEVECKVILSKSSWSIDIWTCRWAHKCDLCVVYICIVRILTLCVLHFFLSYCLKWPGLDIKLFNIEGGWAILGLAVYPYHSGSWASESVSSVQRTISRWWHLHVDNFNPYLSCLQPSILRHSQPSTCTGMQCVWDALLSSFLPASSWWSPHSAFKAA